MDVMSPSKDALGPPFSIDYWFYYIIMLFGGVRVEKQKCHVTKCHLVRRIWMTSGWSQRSVSVVFEVFHGKKLGSLGKG